LTIDPLHAAVDSLKALAHPARLRILALLRGGELCVCQMTEVIGLAPSTVSEHLTLLRRAGAVVERKEGKWVFYALRRGAGMESLCQALWPQLETDEVLREDELRCARVRNTPLVVICSPELKTAPRG
jgi:ArsR family transcriptional regulator, arsenate/arsenite/antimonite-responsive transcriptional repressor